MEIIRAGWIAHENGTPEQVRRDLFRSTGWAILQFRRLGWVRLRSFPVTTWNFQSANYSLAGMTDIISAHP
jgi:hypothetical protein